MAEAGFYMITASVMKELSNADNVFVFYLFCGFISNIHVAREGRLLGITNWISGLQVKFDYD